MAIVIVIASSIAIAIAIAIATAICTTMMLRMLCSTRVRRWLRIINLAACAEHEAKQQPEHEQDKRIAEHLSCCCKHHDVDQQQGDQADREQRPARLAGSAQEVTDRIGEYKDAGADFINIAISPPYDLEAFEAFIEQVLPAFK